MTTNDKIIDKIIESFDDYALLGAAWDCMSDKRKKQFEKSMREIIDAESNSQELHAEPELSR